MDFFENLIVDQSVETLLGHQTALILHSNFHLRTTHEMIVTIAGKWPPNVDMVLRRNTLPSSVFSIDGSNPFASMRLRVGVANHLYIGAVLAINLLDRRSVLICSSQFHQPQANWP